ncbi:hypothetical protein GCM10022225_38780 [Plantactinospora mayteni]|uniref:Uncharacterized protein n=1 Tax=Plantactinospora mayteni TaxID=566021 RepID=A0ABQ4EWQ8_9ACTN|nr:hypothetical protein [Plantactinospora mayteni]GIG99103.1 hypothetical protein Pma05_56760 [Plantactinospora mayteni]
MRNYDDDWAEDQRALYDECYDLGEAWAGDPATDTDQLQDVINLAEADDDELADVELGHPPLVDAVAEATGEQVTSVTADRNDPAFRGFVDGVRQGAEEDVFGL